MNAQAPLDTSAAQDAELGAMSASLDRLHAQARDTQTALDVHTQMLDETDAQMDEAQSRLGLANRKVRRLLKRSDRDRCIRILMLAAFIVIWIFLITPLATSTALF